MLKKQIELIGIEIAEKEVIREQMSYLRSLQDWLEEKFMPLIDLTETNVLITIRRDFSKIFNEWFSALVSDSLSVRLDEDFTPIITNQDYDIDYDFLSGGERTAVALAYRLALNQVINSLLSKIKTKDLIILDEPTDGFSEQQLDKMRDIFNQLEAEQIILVSHEQKIEGFVDNIIRIKKDGSSKIESVKS
jgi:exonuclease SbcC